MANTHELIGTNPDAVPVTLAGEEVLKQNGIRKEGLHHIGPAVAREVEAISQRSEPEDDLWKSIKAEYGEFPLMVLQAIYDYEKREHPEPPTGPNQYGFCSLVEAQIKLGVRNKGIYEPEYASKGK